MSLTYALLGELDAALASGTRALTIAERLGDLRLRILTASCLAWVRSLRGEYGDVVTLALDNLAALPAAWVDDYFGDTVPTAVWDRAWLITSFAELGRFTEAAAHEAELIRIAEPTRFHAHGVGLAHHAAGTLHLVRGDWARARSALDRAVTVYQAGNVHVNLSNALPQFAWVLAQLGEASAVLERLPASEQLLDRLTAMGMVSHGGVGYHALGRACLLLGRLDEAGRLGERVIESSPNHHGLVAQARYLLGDIAAHPDRFDAESGEAHYRQALALAEARGMRPLVAHCHLGLGALYRRAGKREEAREYLTTAATMFGEMDMRFWLEQAEMGA